MRMTNKIMQNNSLYNINNNKILQNKLSTQMSTEKKITRPSDDPVIAIRALRLRNDVSQIKQFYEKNAPDAESWLKITADALNTTTEVINSMLEQCTKGANKDLGADQLEIIVTQLKSLKSEFYATGNVDFAGRSVFTGYRTDTTLTYTEDTTENFSITEQVNVKAVDTINYTNIGDLKGLSKENYDPVTDGQRENEINIENRDIYRIRLSYDNLKLDGQQISIQYVDDPNQIPPQTRDLVAAGDIEVHSMTEDFTPAAYANPYEYIKDNPTKAVLIPETGELLLGSELYDSKFDGMDTNTEIRITYEKDSWKDGDMRPQHYFACENKDKSIKYNQLDYVDQNGIAGKYIPSEKVSQIIEYDVGYNQKIRINTTADEVFTLDLDRNIDDMENALAKLKEIDEIKKNLEKMMKGMDEGQTGYDNLKLTYNAAEKSYTFMRENMQKMFEGLITKVKGTLDATSVAITDNGTRGNRLDLISNRLMTQRTTFETLQSENEDIDVTEVAVQLTSMEYSYQSALMATGKILQNSLMNYI